MTTLTTINNCTFGGFLTYIRHAQIAKVQRRHEPGHPLHWRQQPSIPPCKSVNSADYYLLPAGYIGG